MNYQEFTEWLDAAQIAFPNLGTWIAGLPDGEKTMQVWKKTLEATDAQAAAEVVISWHSAGDRPIKWEDWPWSVKTEAFNRTRKPDPIPTPPRPAYEEKQTDRLNNIKQMHAKIGSIAKNTIFSDPEAVAILDRKTDEYKKQCLKECGYE